MSKIQIEMATRGRKEYTLMDIIIVNLTNLLTQHRAEWESFDRTVLERVEEVR